MIRRLATFVFALIAGLAALPARAADAPIHGLWVWKTVSVLTPPGSAEAVRDFAKANGITEVYVSISLRDHTAENPALLTLIDLLHQEHIRIEALFDSIDADEAGAPREALLAKARAIVQFNATQPQRRRFDGLHLDIEPQQREENKGPGNLRFLSGLVEAFRGVHEIAAPAHLIVNADIANKVLKGDTEQRRALLTSVDRVTLMLYELSSPADGKSEASKLQKLGNAADRYLAMAYEGLNDSGLAGMIIALRTPDYLDETPKMLQSLDDQQVGKPHYLGWAWHCYNDRVK